MTLSKINGGVPVPGPYTESTGNVDPFDHPGAKTPANRARSAERPAPPERGGDKAEISEGAQKMVDLQAAVKAGRAAFAAIPDIRSDAVAQARHRLATGFYNSVEVHEKIAARVEHIVRDVEDV